MSLFYGIALAVYVGLNSLFIYALPVLVFLNSFTLLWMLKGPLRGFALLLRLNTFTSLILQFFLVQTLIGWGLY